MIPSPTTPNCFTRYTLGNSTTSYKYGPEGRRVRKVTPTVTETCVYDAFSKLAAEYFTAAPPACTVSPVACNTPGKIFSRITRHETRLFRCLLVLKPFSLVFSAPAC